MSGCTGFSYANLPTQKAIDHCTITASAQQDYREEPVDAAPFMAADSDTLNFDRHTFAGRVPAICVASRLVAMRNGRQSNCVLPCSQNGLISSLARAG